jgi:hypothetical protein
MSFKIKCPTCERFIYSDAKKCQCGWKSNNSHESFSDAMISCANFSCEKKGLKNLNRVNEKEYLCEFHWEEFVLKNQNNPYYQIDAQRILLTRKFIQEAKDLGISNYEYFKRNCSGWCGVKESLVSMKDRSEKLM